jgi:hypothetical protein
MHKHNKGDLQAPRIPYLILAQHERKKYSGKIKDRNSKQLRKQKQKKDIYT